MGSISLSWCVFIMPARIILILIYSWYSYQAGSALGPCHIWLSFTFATVHENLGHPLTYLLSLNFFYVPVTLPAPYYLMTTATDKGQRKLPRNLYSTDLSSQPLPVILKTLICSVTAYWHSVEQAMHTLQAWAVLESSLVHPALQGLRALSHSDLVLCYFFLTCY